MKFAPTISLLPIPHSLLVLQFKDEMAAIPRHAGGGTTERDFRIEAFHEGKIARTDEFFFQVHRIIAFEYVDVGASVDDSFQARLRLFHQFELMTFLA